MPCESTCEGRTNRCSDASILDIDDFKSELTKLRADNEVLREQLTMNHGTNVENNETLRSRSWFNRPEDISMRVLYAERYFNYGKTISKPISSPKELFAYSWYVKGLTKEEIIEGRPIIGIAQSGSDTAPVSQNMICPCRH